MTRRALVMKAVPVLALIATAAMLSLPFADLPHVSPMYLLVFVAGMLGGPVWGLVVGSGAMILYAALSGALGAHAVVAAIGMAEAGGLAGLLARARFRRYARSRMLAAMAACAAAGAAFTLLFSMTADVTEWLLVVTGLVPMAHTPQLGGVVLAGLSFNVATAAANAGIFALAVPILGGLEAAARTGFGRRWAAPLLAAADRAASSSARGA